MPDYREVKEEIAKSQKKCNWKEVQVVNGDQLSIGLPEGLSIKDAIKCIKRSQRRKYFTSTMKAILILLL